MSNRQWIILLLLGLVMVAGTAAFERAPGYMDAEYYTATGFVLASGDGFTEPFLWNYFIQPASIPQPSHLYWMPLPSIVAAGGIALFGGGWRAAQVPFVFLGALLPALTAFVAGKISQDRRSAWRAGLLALFPGFFLPYLGTVDSFALYAVLGSLILLLLSRRERWAFSMFLVGVLIALAHLTRADGVLFFLLAAAAILTSDSRRLRNLALVGVGYAVGMSPWWIRNATLLGTLMPDTSRAFWLTTYDDLFAFPIDRINLQTWLASGWKAILQARLDALSINVQRVVAETGMVFLLPFMLLGGWIRRRERLVWLSGLYFLGVFGVMTFIFPFAGANGGLFHSGAAVLPVMLSLAPIGIQRAVEWGSSRRNWDLAEAAVVFHSAAVVMLGILTLGSAAGKLGVLPPGGKWSGTDTEYRSYDSAVSIYAEDNRPGAVNNPPGYYLASGRSTVVIPNGGPDVLKQVVQTYDVAWVLLEPNHPRGLNNLYLQPNSESWLDLVDTMEDSIGRPVYLLSVVDQGALP